MRGIAIIAVLIIHITANAAVSSPVGSKPFIFYNFINSLALFAVPHFLFISSLVLSYKLSQEKIDLISFSLKRLRTSLAPYLIWSALYMAYIRIAYGYGELFSIVYWVKQLYQGTAFYHLYYLLIIIQLYLLIPLIHRFIGKTSFPVFLAATVLCQALFYIVNKAIIYKIYPYPGCLIGSYLTVFFLGTWLGVHYEKALTVLQKNKYLIYGAALLAAGVFIYTNTNLRMNKQMSLNVYYLIYHSFAVMASLALWLSMQQSTNILLKNIGEYSFGIFLVHPLILDIWNKCTFFSGDISLWLGFVVVFVLSYIISLFITKQNTIRKILLSR